eukprot:scaffold92717_cov31-Tisochrysis_lutea.AAC.2
MRPLFEKSSGLKPTARTRGVDRSWWKKAPRSSSAAVKSSGQVPSGKSSTDIDAVGTGICAPWSSICPSASASI